MRTKTLDSLLKKVLIILILVFVSSGCVLLYFFFFEKVTLHFGFLLSMSYTPLGLIWEGWLVVSTNPALRLTLELLLLVPLLVIFLLTPLWLFTPLGRIGYETVGEAVKGFKALIWSTKEGKRTVVSMMIGGAIYCLIILLSLLSVFYVIRQDTGLIVALLLFFGITGLINFLVITPRYQRIRDQKLQAKQGSVKPKDT
nr:hypothetical protein [Candidatus Freyarchaeota archaeon]